MHGFKQNSFWSAAFPTKKKKLCAVILPRWIICYCTTFSTSTEFILEGYTTTKPVYAELLL